MENNVKSFKNPAPYRVEVEDCQGNAITLTAIPIRKKEMLDIDNIRQNKKINDVERLGVLCALIFNCPVERFTDISFQVLNAVLTDFFKDQQNPIKG